MIFDGFWGLVEYELKRMWENCERSGNEVLYLLGIMRESMRGVGEMNWECCEELWIGGDNDKMTIYANP